MPTLIVYRCPQSGLMTQTWLPKELVKGDRATYEPVTCLACSKQHFICIETGHVLGEPARSRAGEAPTFPPKQFRRSFDRASPSIASDGAPAKDAAIKTPRPASDLPKAC